MSQTSPCAEVLPEAKPQAGPPILFPVALLVVATVLVGMFGLDMWFAAQAYDGKGGWTLNSTWFVQFLYRFGNLPAVITASIAGIIWLGSAFNERLRTKRDLAMFLALSMVIGPGLVINGIFKEYYGRPRPRDVVDFGGQRAFAPVWEPHTGEGGKSLPCGHASTGFFWLTLGVFYSERNRRLAIAFTVLGLVHGMFMGFGRIAQGGHWFSDVVWAAGMVYLVSWSLYHALRLSSEYCIPVPDDPEPTGPDLTGAGFSVVVPFYNESENIVEILRELRSTLPEAELIAIDDGSSDDTWAQIQGVEGIRGLRFTENLGQSAAIFHGLRAATQPVVGMMDGDGQNDPANFKLLLAEFAKGQVDVVCGYRANRRDTLSRRAASRIANAIRRAFLDDGVRDTGCSQKVFYREAAELLVPFRGLHRYLPAIFKQAGLRIAEVPVNHRPRRAGVSKYGNWTRAIHGIHDLVGVSWLLSRKIVFPQIATKR